MQILLILVVKSGSFPAGQQAGQKRNRLFLGINVTQIRVPIDEGCEAE